MAPPDCVLANDELILRFEVRQFLLLQHLDNIGHFPEFGRNASGHCGRNVSGRSGGQLRAMSMIDLASWLGVAGAFWVASHAGFPSGRLTSSNVAT